MMNNQSTTKPNTALNDKITTRDFFAEGKIKINLISDLNFKDEISVFELARLLNNDVDTDDNKLNVNQLRKFYDVFLKIYF
ncbi:MAG: hypothetical protein IAE91_07450, partial [Ignavibacteriaceae bacterium]|nr:hypothetical protein [Ignavibacteriaceae bacterium]